MRHATRPRLVAAAALSLAIGVWGCGADDTLSPSGTATAKLVAYPNLSTSVAVWEDVAPAYPDTIGDLLIGYRTYRLGEVSQVNGQIYDQTPATTYQVLKQVPDGRFLEVKDYGLQPAQRFLDRQWEVYAFVDPDTVRSSVAAYQGRGVVQGVVSSGSPVTNVALLPDTVVGDITARVIFNINPIGNVRYIDSLFTMEWNTVPGAAYYIFSVYQMRADQNGYYDIVASGIPAPIYSEKAKIQCLAWLPASGGSVMRYKVGDPASPLMTWLPTFYGREYLVRISAIAADGHLIAVTRGDSRWVGEEGGYIYIPLSAYVVAPTRCYQCGN